MATPTLDLEPVKSKILTRVAAVAQAGNVAEVARWSRLAEECEVLLRDGKRLDERIHSFVVSLEQTATAVAPEPHNDVASQAPISAKRQGAEVRSEWIERLAQAGIALRGRGKRFETTNRQLVSVGFANELPGLPNKWFLGTVDEQTDVVVLLCRDSRLHVHDFVVPVGDMGARWKLLARANGQIKFNVRRDVSEFWLLVPGAQPFSLTSYLGRYTRLNGAA